MDFADFESYPSLFADDFNVWEEQQVFLDNEGAADEVVEADDVAGFEDDGYEEALGLD
jgi:hypothetical protein